MFSVPLEDNVVSDRERVKFSVTITAAESEKLTVEAAANGMQRAPFVAELIREKLASRESLDRSPSPAPDVLIALDGVAKELNRLAEHQALAHRADAAWRLGQADVLEAVAVSLATDAPAWEAARITDFVRQALREREGE